ncbi:hypothetical protein [Pseudonocardia sp. TRM90224]|uniref:hypothetical protein n=1 Tax=Pseudonocardia sp. TRM90224 TaxID=2812678 RepID=UPI001E4F8379|nr:hypothetical protein [Pseudonocardia sp. TRM90224]
MTASWSDAVDEIMGGDQVVVLAHRTPAAGVVLTPLTNFRLRDRPAATATVNSSVGAPRKLQRIRADPRVALAYHTRAHSETDRSEFVLLQGEAVVSAPIADYPAHLGELWDRCDGTPPSGALWRRWLRVYHTRSEITVTARRALAWPDLTCRGEPEVLGEPRPGAAPPQRPPARGTGPRIDHRKLAAAITRLPDPLLGWVGGDGLPCVVTARLSGVTPHGFRLDAPAGLLPVGGRRAGLTANAFTRHVLGQHQHVLTGWLDVSPDGVATYAPHTRSGHHLPPSTAVYRLAAGYATRRGLRTG